MNEKKILMSIFKSKMFYVSIALLGLLFILDIAGVRIGASSTDPNLSLGTNAIQSAVWQFWSMLKIVPPIFLLIGLLDIWVPKETMIKLMGEKSGVIGILIAFFIGTMSAGPLVAAFPVAQIMLKKGARYAYVLFFLMTWASAKLPILFFQATTLGMTYTLLSNVTLIIVYLTGSSIIEKLMTREEKAVIYSLAEAS